MPQVIDPHGLFNGERMRRCSDLARYAWPYFWVASNGYARMEINYDDFFRLFIGSFETKINKEEFFALIREYRDNYLLFLYKANNQLWGQWLTDNKYLPRHKTAKDRQSPEPPLEKFAEFQQQYELSRTTVPADFENFGDVPEVILRPSQTFQNISENFGEFPLGVGVGVGIGKGKEPSREDFSATDSTTLLLMRMKLSGDKMRALARDAIKTAMMGLDFDGLKAADFIANKWDEYGESAVKFKVGKQKFLEGGVFLEKSFETSRGAVTIPQERPQW